MPNLNSDECDPRAASDRGVWDVRVATRHDADAIVWLDDEDWLRAVIVHRNGRARVTTLGRGRSPTVAPTRHGFAIAWLDRGRLRVTVLPSADLA